MYITGVILTAYRICWCIQIRSEVHSEYAAQALFYHRAVKYILGSSAMKDTEKYICRWLLATICIISATLYTRAWWRHQMETFSALLAICAGNSPVTGEFPAQRPVTRSFDVFFDLRLNKRLSKQSWCWWFETSLRPLWRHSNGLILQIWFNLPFNL